MQSSNNAINQNIPSEIANNPHLYLIYQAYSEQINLYGSTDEMKIAFAKFLLKLKDAEMLDTNHSDFISAIKLSDNLVTLFKLFSKLAEKKLFTPLVTNHFHQCKKSIVTYINRVLSLHQASPRSITSENLQSLASKAQGARTIRSILGFGSNKEKNTTIANDKILEIIDQTYKKQLGKIPRVTPKNALIKILSSLFASNIWDENNRAISDNLVELVCDQKITTTMLKDSLTILSKHKLLTQRILSFYGANLVSFTSGIVTLSSTPDLITDETLSQLKAHGAPYAIVLLKLGKEDMAQSDKDYILNASMTCLDKIDAADAYLDLFKKQLINRTSSEYLALTTSRDGLSTDLVRNAFIIKEYGLIIDKNFATVCAFLDENTLRAMLDTFENPQSIIQYLSTKRVKNFDRRNDVCTNDFFSVVYNKTFIDVLIKIYKNHKNKMEECLGKIQWNTIDAKDYRSITQLRNLEALLSLNLYTRCHVQMLRHPQSDLYLACLRILDNYPTMLTASITLLDGIKNLRDYFCAILSKLHDTNLLNQENFSILVAHHKLFNSDSFNFDLSRVISDFPPMLFTQEVFNRLIMQENAAGIRDILNNMMAVNFINVATQESNLNPKQSTHTASVHRSASDSAIRLRARYPKVNSELDVIILEMEKWIQSLPNSENNHHDSDFYADVKSAFQRLTDPSFYFEDRDSHTSITQLLALAWLGTHDTGTWCDSFVALNEHRLAPSSPERNVLYVKKTLNNTIEFFSDNKNVRELTNEQVDLISKMHLIFNGTAEHNQEKLNKLIAILGYRNSKVLQASQNDAVDHLLIKLFEIVNEYKLDENGKIITQMAHRSKMQTCGGGAFNHLIQALYFAGHTDAETKYITKELAGITLKGFCLTLVRNCISHLKLNSLPDFTLLNHSIKKPDFEDSDQALLLWNKNKPELSQKLAKEFIAAFKNKEEIDDFVEIVGKDCFFEFLITEINLDVQIKTDDLVSVSSGIQKDSMSKNNIDDDQEDSHVEEIDGEKYSESEDEKSTSNMTIEKPSSKRTLDEIDEEDNSESAIKKPRAESTGEIIDATTRKYSLEALNELNDLLFADSLLQRLHYSSDSNAIKAVYTLLLEEMQRAICNESSQVNEALNLWKRLVDLLQNNSSSSSRAEAKDPLIESIISKISLIKTNLELQDKDFNSNSSSSSSNNSSSRHNNTFLNHSTVLGSSDSRYGSHANTLFSVATRRSSIIEETSENNNDNIRGSVANSNFGYQKS